MVIANHDYVMELASDHSSLDLATNSFGIRVNQGINLLTQNVISFVTFYYTKSCWSFSHFIKKISNCSLHFLTRKKKTPIAFKN